MLACAQRSWLRSWSCSSKQSGQMPWLARLSRDCRMCWWPLPMALRCSHSSPILKRSHQAQRQMLTSPLRAARRIRERRRTRRACAVTSSACVVASDARRTTSSSPGTQEERRERDAGCGPRSSCASASIPPESAWFGRCLLGSVELRAIERSTLSWRAYGRLAPWLSRSQAASSGCSRSATSLAMPVFSTTTYPGWRSTTRSS